MLFNRLTKNKVSPAGGAAPEETVQRKNEESKPFAGELNADSTGMVVGIEKHLFSHTGNDIPIVFTGKSSTAYNLQVKGKLFESNEVVLEDASNGVPVVVLERKYATAGNTFNIYTTRPVYSNQKPANLLKYKQRLYAFATVIRRGKVLSVVKEGQSEPSYTIHKVLPNPSRRFMTRHIIEEEGKKVAFTRSGQGNSYILTMLPGAVDACLMISLAIISDEMDK